MRNATCPSLRSPSKGTCAPNDMKPHPWGQCGQLTRGSFEEPGKASQLTGSTALLAWPVLSQASPTVLAVSSEQINTLYMLESCSPPRPGPRGDPDSEDRAPGPELGVDVDSVGRGSPQAPPPRLMECLGSSSGSFPGRRGLVSADTADQGH